MLQQMCISSLKDCLISAGVKPTTTTYFFSVFFTRFFSRLVFIFKSDTMCKKTAQAIAGTPGTSQENSNTNIGLLNMSSEQMGGPMTAQSVMTYIIAAICLFMVFKWAKKCYGRRQAKKRELIRSLSQQTPMVNQNQGVQMPMQQISAPIPAPLPALPAPIIIHPNQFKIGLEGTEERNFDRMEKYRN